jgi:hypothetical protein
VTTAGWARASRRTGWHPLVAGLALTLATILGGTAAAPRADAAPTPAGRSCAKAVGPFSVHGSQVLGPGGKAFVSYGITVPGLQVPDWQASINLDLEKIAASARDWCANTVRLQLSENNLLGPTGTGFDQAYMSAIAAEVWAAESDHLVVVLNDDTELTTPRWNSELGPTAATETFWKDIARTYGADPQVIFDLFNEPRIFYTSMSLEAEWHLWLDGGLFLGGYYPFGMAQLAGYVRNTLHAKNLLWVEGPRFSVSFAGMVREGALLKVSGVVYAVHHPAGPRNSSAWYADFGYLVATGVAPVVDGEWTNYEPAPTAKPGRMPTSCWPDAPTAVPAFLRYLSSLGVGLNVYQLQPGYMIKSYGNLADPTTINGSTWSCRSDRERQPGQGAGSLVKAWFEQRNG